MKAVRIRTIREPLELLLDTGATVCTINEEVIGNEKVDTTRTMRMEGIGGELSTLGTIDIQLVFNNVPVVQTFHVIPKKFRTPHDGILGNPVLMKWGAVISYPKQALILANNGDRIEIPFVNSSSKGIHLLVPARTELKCKLPVSGSGEVVTIPMEVGEGIFLARAVTEAENGKATVLVVNTTEKDVRIPDLTVDTQPMSEFTIKKEKDTGNRWKALKKELQTGGLNGHETDQIYKLCREFADIFYLDGDSLKTTTVGKQKIRIKEGAEPVYRKPYRNPHHQKGLVREYINKLKKDRIVEPAVSPWNAPLLLVPKKNLDKEGKRQYRVCIDYRGLNGVIQQDRYPLPNIQDIIDQLGKAKYFTTIDLSQGYFQVELEEDSRPYTAFITPDGEHLQMRKMPMGLSTSPAAFSRIMSMALAGLKGTRCLVYLDDLIVFSKTVKEHMKNLEEVFLRLRKANLQIHPGKTVFLQKTVLFLGYVVDGNGIRPDPKKVELIKNWHRPENVKQVQQFFGLASFYRQFIENFAKKSRALSLLLKKGKEFVWTESCEKAFNVLKEEICSEKVLAFPDFEKEFTVYTDASKYALGAVLQNADGRPVHFASRILKPAEMNYATVEKELLAMVFATKIFRPYLLGKHFTFKTDHRPLQWVFKMADPSTRLIKFGLRLEEFNFSVDYIPGETNTAADALSREPTELEKQMVMILTRSMARQEEHNVIAQPKDTETWRLKCKGRSRKVKPVTRLQELQVDPNMPGYNMKKQMEKAKRDHKIARVVVTKSQRETHSKVIKALGEADIQILTIGDVMELRTKKSQREAMESIHSEITGGHPGVVKTLKTLQKYFFWKGMSTDVANFVANCAACQQHKKQGAIKAAQIVTDTPSKPFQKIYLDLVGPIDPTSVNQHRYILTIKDDFSKFLVAIPIKRKTAETVAKGFVENWVLKFGVPEKVVTDQGREFLGIMTEVTKLLTIDAKMSAAYHHQTVGTLENSHKSLGNYLRIYAGVSNQWHEKLPFFVFAYNSTVNLATGYTPFELTFGQVCRKIDTGKLDPREQPPRDYDSYVKQLQYKMTTAYEDAAKCLKSNKVTNCQRAGGSVINYDIGDKILIKNETAKKLDNVWEGPFVVEKCEYPNVTAKCGGKSETVHMNRTKLFKDNQQGVSD